MREILISQTITLLNHKNYSISTYLHLNNCFDLAAKKNNQIFLLKILSNIDALREEQANELRRLGLGFNAAVFVIGEKSKTFNLNTGIIYERYSVNCVSIETFKDILENNFPQVKYFKGKKIVELDMKKLKEKRKELGFTLEEVAKKINSTPESIHRYETLGSASLQVAEKLEHALHAKIVKKIDALNQPEPEHMMHPKNIDDAFEKIEKLGLKLEFFSHAPFKAYSHPQEMLYFNQTKRETEISKKAEELSKTKKIVGGIPLIIAKESDKKTVANIPIIKEEELYSMSKKKNLIELAKERQKK